MTNTTKTQLAEKHSFTREAIFRFKTAALISNRILYNLKWPVKRFHHSDKIQAPVIAFSESELRTQGNSDNPVLTAGKIENLRIAARKLNGLEIKANKVFSFWKHIGNPNFGKGYVIGREIREGCIIPTIGGGLCQLSNALYDAALKAGFTIIERHKHTKVIPGSLAERDRDATVKWNYVDLRFKSDTDFRIEIELTGNQLIVAFKSNKTDSTLPNQPDVFRAPHDLNDCYTCGNTNCYKHTDTSSFKPSIVKTTFILDEKWIEYDEFVHGYAFLEDFFIVPLLKNKLVKTDRYAWKVKDIKNTRATTKQGLYRAMMLRLASKGKNNVFGLTLKLDRKIARRAAKLIPLETTHVIVSQNLLPHLYETGALGGRTYDVLMTRLPMEKLHQQLDEAAALYPDSKTLNDFRAPTDLIALENKALTRAEKIVTPHTGIASLFNNKVMKLHWRLPQKDKSAIMGSKVLFPASALDRKGAVLVKRLAEELQLQLVVSGNIEDKFWNGIPVEKFTGDFDQIGLVVYPVFAEHQPRQILKAMLYDIPVITTPACGLDDVNLVTVVPAGDYDQLKRAAESIIQNSKFFNTKN